MVEIKMKVGDEVVHLETKRQRDEEILSKLKSGFTVTQTADMFFCTRQTIYNIIKKVFKDEVKRKLFIETLEKH